MSEDTTTPTTQDDTQAQDAQPEAPETQAVQETEVSTDDAQPAATGDSSDEELTAWAEKKGIDPNDPVKLMKMVRESESKMHQATQEASQLRDVVQDAAPSTGNQSQDEAYGLINRLRVTEFFLNNPDARQLEAQMAEIVEKKPYLAEDLDTVLVLAQSKSAPRDAQIERQAGRKEALQAVAKAEKAAPPAASASTRQQPSDKIPEFSSVAEYDAWKAKTGFDPFKAP